MSYIFDTFGFWYEFLSGLRGFSKQPYRTHFCLLDFGRCHVLGRIHPQKIQAPFTYPPGTVVLTFRYSRFFSFPFFLLGYLVQIMMILEKAEN